MTNEQHVSPNDAEEGSFVYAAEAWALRQGLAIPDAQCQPYMFQGMLDDYQTSEPRIGRGNNVP
jgi:hypothetical protein